jgi:hypothetical protein
MEDIFVVDGMWEMLDVFQVAAILTHLERSIYNPSKFETAAVGTAIVTLM